MVDELSCGRCSENREPRSEKKCSKKRKNGRDSKKRCCAKEVSKQNRI